MKRMSLKGLVIFNVLESILLILIQLFLIQESIKCGINIYILILSVVNGCLIGKEVMDWVKVVNVIQLSRIFNPKRMIKKINKMNGKHLKDTCKEAYGKDWKGWYKELKKLGSFGMWMANTVLMKKKELQKRVEEKR